MKTLTFPVLLQWRNGLFFRTKHKSAEKFIIALFWVLKSWTFQHYFLSAEKFNFSALPWVSKSTTFQHLCRKVQLFDTNLFLYSAIISWSVFYIMDWLFTVREASAGLLVLGQISIAWINVFLLKMILEGSFSELQKNVVWNSLQNSIFSALGVFIQRGLPFYRNARLVLKKSSFCNSLHKLLFLHP